jgi:glycosyltransferase involved in cell wall biosynthesis
LEIARKYTDKVFIKGPERCTQRNFGASMAAGEYVVFIDSDMKLAPQVIESCVAKMTEDSHLLGIVIPEESFGVGFWAQCKKLERSFYVGVPWMEAARFFKKSAFDAVNGYDEALVSGEDWDLSQRIEKNGPLGRINDFIYHNEGHPKLLNTIKKKFYYAREFAKYKDIRSDSTNVAKQTNVFFRYGLFFKKPSPIVQHPILFIGMLFMKTTEFFFGGLGYLFASKKIEAASATAVIRDADLPSISFVLPTYNAEQYLVKCLDSIVMQDYPKEKVEILLVDGGSTDSTLDIARRYPVRILPNEKRIAEYGKTIGILASKGEHFVLIDADNEIVERDWLLQKR